MAVARKFEKCALVIGILSSLEEKRDELLNLLEKDFGPILHVSRTLDFPYTDYYDKEMSGHPVRYLIMFSNSVDPALLADYKMCTNEIEHVFENEAGRRINIDPGVLSLSNFVLASCKNRSHRIALKSGVYAELTLIYQNKDFQCLPWTYADYASEEVKEILRFFRTEYKSRLVIAETKKQCLTEKEQFCTCKP